MKNKMFADERIIIKQLKDELVRRNISIYELAKKVPIPYEILRRTFNGTRKLRADELFVILEACKIPIQTLI